MKKMSVNENAYGKRNIFLIFLRKLVYYFFEVFRRVLLLIRKPNSEVRQLLIWPGCKTEEELIGIANKMVWTFPEKELIIPVSPNLLNFDLFKAEPLYQRNYLCSSKNKIKLVKFDEVSYDFFLRSDRILVNNWLSLFNFSVLFNFHKGLIVDPFFYSTVECGIFDKSSWSSDFEYKMKEVSLKNFKSMVTNNNFDVAYCFTTGPSFDRYKEFNYEENSFKVVCNSAIKNDDFLKYIGGPSLIVFADPVFHFSTCEYSAAFRDKLLEVVTEYKCFVMVPQRYLCLLAYHYSEIKSFLIGMPTVKEELCFPTDKKFCVKGTANILTLLMVPVASSLANNVYIIGSDGRKPDEKYFWQHSKSAQYHGEMDSAFYCHPSFFRDRVYTSYYKNHCDLLEKMFSYGEKNGKKYFSLTPSYIPALERRMVK
jgi:hypothetical protein